MCTITCSQSTCLNVRSPQLPLIGKVRHIFGRISTQQTFYPFSFQECKCFLQLCLLNSSSICTFHRLGMYVHVRFQNSPCMLSFVSQPRFSRKQSSRSTPLRGNLPRPLHTSGATYTLCPLFIKLAVYLTCSGSLPESDLCVGYKLLNENC